MTHNEFINAAFRKTDEIVVRQYFSRQKEKIVSVDFTEETINGYPISMIEKHIKRQNNDQTQYHRPQADRI